MEGLISQRVTPLLKCMVLFLFIFTAKVLTSRPQEAQDSRIGIHHLKPSHYVRTFTKYHHRRTIQWNSLNDINYWPQDHPKVIGKRSAEPSSDFISHYWPGASEQDYKEKVIRKRSVNGFISDENWPDDLNFRKRSLDVLNSKELVRESSIESSVNFADSRDIVGSYEKPAISSSKDNYGVKNGVSNDVKKTKVKAAMIVTDPPTTLVPSISCLYKIHSIAKSVTPSYDDERNAQLMVENDSFAPGPITETTLPNGEIAEVEECMSPRPSCYTLWHKDKDGNITILGQGCWHSSQMQGKSSCDKCTSVNALLPGSKFCCCTRSYCNADFLSLKEETVTMKAGSTMDTGSQQTNYSNAVATMMFILVAMLVTVVLLKMFYCKRPRNKEDLSDSQDLEKGDIIGGGPDTLATGLLCVDNLTLIEHIGQGKFGTVWRGSLGSTPVAVKLYSNVHTWQREAAIYCLKHLAHPNILRYYGSDTRPTLTEGGGREYLIVLELCPTTLRSRLEQTPLTWMEYATIAHGLASALAHLHTATSTKPCVVHRDVNSNNVLISSSGDARLADLGLAQLLHRGQQNAPTRITEAGTLRYLAPEALEGALDLSGARAALCAVDVFALALVLWEMLWRCSGAHPHAAPPYAPPYHHHGLPHKPELHQMQSVVSRNKARPPLPRGPVPEARALRLAADTCDECWDHDAEARLTAVCVEERMAELKQMLQAQGPVIHDNNLHPHPPDTTNQEQDKNSNCIVSQNYDVTTPLLYPQPHIGRNACIERNTHTNTQTHTVQLIHKSLKDITAPIEAARAPNVEENCLSVARVVHRHTLPENSDRLNEIRSYQRPLDYVQNDVSSHEEKGPKQTNLLQDVKVEKPKWGIKRFFEKLNKNKVDTEVKLVPESSVNKTQTSLVEKPSNITFDRPTNLVLNQDRNPYNFEGPCTLSPPNRTLSPTMMLESDLNRENNVFGFKELPTEVEGNKAQNQIFAVIVPKAKPSDFVEMRSKTSKGSSESINKFRTSMSSQSILKSAHSESEDSTVKKRLSCDNKIITNSNSGRSSRASINLELQYINGQTENYNDSPFDINSDCSSSEDEHIMLLSENGGSKITMQTIPKPESDKKRYQNEVLKESSQVTDFGFNKYQNKYTNFDNEYSDPNDKENLGYSGDNPVYLAALNGEIDTTDLKFLDTETEMSPKPSVKSLAIKRQHSLEQVSEIFSSSGDITLQNPAGRVKTPGDLPVAVRRARRDRALQKGRASECNRLSLYDDRMMFGNSL